MKKKQAEEIEKALFHLMDCMKNYTMSGEVALKSTMNLYLLLCISTGLKTSDFVDSLEMALKDFVKIKEKIDVT